MDADKSKEFYDKLISQLYDTSSWPSTYLYKFIVLTDQEKIKTIHTIFDNTGAVIDSKKSKNGKYTSLSITVNMQNPEAVVAKYKEVTQVEGVISL
ncbi:DUF493 family protein [uncultured Maribacter sp.]|uniref:DUF493 family protein n=1 Tax=uncultured Maribacter sp. TaxID=431308 RepID=UPI002612E032|nr:DUF493 family protein [uncultured Maribacter sp.]